MQDSNPILPFDKSLLLAAIEGRDTLTSMIAPPIAMTIAGSDCSAGAGLQADLKTFASLGVHGLTAVSCVVSETPLTVSKVHPVPPVILQDQIRLLKQSYPIEALKTGMLYSKAHIVAVCELIGDMQIPIVVDPVMVASTGDPLLVADALEAIATRLLPLASVITPNIPEAEILLGRKITNFEQQQDAARDLARKYKLACYLKGGHAKTQDKHLDVISHHDYLEVFEAPHRDLPQSHGTGCTLAAAMTAELAKSPSISAAARRAHQFTQEALRQAATWVTPSGNLQISHLDQIQHS